jgi:hypothetical protein
VRRRYPIHAKRALQSCGKRLMATQSHKRERESTVVHREKKEKKKSKIYRRRLEAPNCPAMSFYQVGHTASSVLLQNPSQSRFAPCKG